MARVGNGPRRGIRHPVAGGEEEQRPGAGRLSNDEMLRNHGFRIQARPEKGPTIWRHPEGGTCTEADALHHVLREIKAQGGERNK